MSNFEIFGIKKSKREKIIDETDLKEGKKLSESFLTNTKNYLINKFQKEGFLNTKVYLNTKKDTLGDNTLKLLINIDRGVRVKVKSIKFMREKGVGIKKIAKELNVGVGTVYKVLNPPVSPDEDFGDLDWAKAS